MNIKTLNNSAAKKSTIESDTEEIGTVWACRMNDCLPVDESSENY